MRVVKRSTTDERRTEGKIERDGGFYDVNRPEDCTCVHFCDNKRLIIIFFFTDFELYSCKTPVILKLSTNKRGAFV